jgi:hypothetical protein
MFWSKRCKLYGFSILVVLFLGSGSIGYADHSAGDSYLRWKPGKGFYLTPELKLGASYRVRSEFKTDFKYGAAVRANHDEYLLHQLRMNLDWAPTQWLNGFFELQDARIFFSDSVNTNSAPTTFHDQFDIHQLYLDLKPEIKKLPIRIRTGRQKLNFGKQRLVGALEWANTARVFDAVRTTLGTEKERTLDIVTSRVVSTQGHGFNDWGSNLNRYFSSDFHGLYYSDWLTIPNLKGELYYLFRHNDRAQDQAHTYATRLWNTWGQWDGNLEVAGQFGEFGGDDHYAFAGHIESGYRLENFFNTWIGFAYNYASGDDDPNDGDHTTFDNLFPTNHAFYGYMDFFSWQNIHEVVFKSETSLMSRIKLKINYHNFWLANDQDAWYNAGLGTIRRATKDVSNYVGSELDFLMNYALVPEQVWLLAGYSHFFSGSFVRDTGPSEDADFVYFQTKIAL